MPSPDSERCRETYNSPVVTPEPALVTVARENCRLLEERAAYIRKLRRLSEQLMGENERLTAAQQVVEQAAQRDYQLAQEWQQRCEELRAECETLRDKDAAAARRIQELEATLRALDVRVLTAAHAVEQITNSTLGGLSAFDDQPDNWYAAELARLGTPTA